MIIAKLYRVNDTKKHQMIPSYNQYNNESLYRYIGCGGRVSMLLRAKLRHSYLRHSREPHTKIPTIIIIFYSYIKQ